LRKDRIKKKIQKRREAKWVDPKEIIRDIKQKSHVSNAEFLIEDTQNKESLYLLDTIE